jgi:hypothetical protein
MDQEEFEAMTTPEERAEMEEGDQTLVPPDEWNIERGFVSMDTSEEL